jgi:hypothetical protein
MHWKAFKDELPKEGHQILVGNHRYVQQIVYQENHRVLKENLCFKPISHWTYFDLPPLVDFEDKWKKT